MQRSSQKSRIPHAIATALALVLLAMASGSTLAFAPAMADAVCCCCPADPAPGAACAPAGAADGCPCDIAPAEPPHAPLGVALAGQGNPTTSLVTPVAAVLAAVVLEGPALPDASSLAGSPAPTPVSRHLRMNC